MDDTYTHLPAFFVCRRIARLCFAGTFADTVSDTAFDLRRTAAVFKIGRAHV